MGTHAGPPNRGRASLKGNATLGSIVAVSVYPTWINAVATLTLDAVRHGPVRACVQACGRGCVRAGAGTCVVACSRPTCGTARARARVPHVARRRPQEAVSSTHYLLQFWARMVQSTYAYVMAQRSTTTDHRLDSLVPQVLRPFAQTFPVHVIGHRCDGRSQYEGVCRGLAGGMNAGHS